MRKFLLACTALAAMSLPASAEVVVTGKLSSTGDLVNFNSISGDVALATLNGQHTGTVQFQDLTGSTTFTAAANGNDIKIEGSQNLFIRVFDTAQNLVGTTTQVFSITGTADSQILAFVQSVDANGKDEGIQAFDLTALFGALKPGQNGYTFTAINGEVMESLRILDVGGTITDFEHYRLDVAAIPVAAVPEASTWAMMIAGFFGIGGLTMLKRRRAEGKHAFRLA